MNSRPLRRGYPSPLHRSRKVCKIACRRRANPAGLCLFYVLTARDADYLVWREELDRAVARLARTASALSTLAATRLPVIRALRDLESLLNRHMTESYELRERMIGVLTARFRGRGVSKQLTKMKGDRKERKAATDAIARRVGRTPLVSTANRILASLEVQIGLRNAKTHNWHPMMLLDDGRWMYDPFEFWKDSEGRTDRAVIERTLRYEIRKICTRYRTGWVELEGHLRRFQELATSEFQPSLLEIAREGNG